MVWLNRLLIFIVDYLCHTVTKMKIFVGKLNKLSKSSSPWKFGLVHLKIFDKTIMAHIIWRRFIGDIIWVRNSSQPEIINFVDFASQLHATIKFTCEMSSQGAVFLDTEVFQDRVSRRRKYSMSKHTSKLHNLCNARISVRANPSAKKRFY